MFFYIHWPANGLNPWKIKRDKKEIAAARIQADFEVAQIKFAILAQHGKLGVTMDNIISRFPDYAVRIFDSLDDHNYVKSMTLVSKSWHDFTNNDEFFYHKTIRITLNKLRGGYKDFKEAWKLVLDKANTEMIKELALALTVFLLYHPESCPHQGCKHRSVPHSPLHIAAEAGRISLCEFILKVTKDKNPRITSGPVLDLGWTPLHEAANGGHLEMCKLLIGKMQEKNPVDNSGWTPLHFAAKSGHGEVCKLIAGYIGNKNPMSYDGYTPRVLMTNFACELFRN